MKKRSPKEQAAFMVISFMGDGLVFDQAKAASKRSAYWIGLEVNEATQSTSSADHWNAVIAEIDQLQLT